MKKIAFIALVPALLLACGGGEEKTAKEKRDSVEEHHDSIEDRLEGNTEGANEVDDDYDRYKAELNARIERNEKDIAELWAKKSKESGEVREKYKKKIDKLEKENKELKARLANQPKDTKWEEFKREFDHDMDELGKAIKDLGVDNKE